MSKRDFFRHVYLCIRCHEKTSRIAVTPAPLDQVYCGHCHTSMGVDCCIESTYENPPRLENDSLCMSIIFAALLDGAYPDDSEAIDEYIGTTFLIWDTLQKELKVYYSGEGESDE